MAIELRKARPDEIEAVRALIVAGQMPVIKLERWIEEFWVLDDDGELVGCAGVESHGPAAVLRSVAITPSLRGTGQGVRLVQHCLDYARENGAKRCYLFTMTAENFFTKFGFERCTLDDFEPTVRKSWQYRGNVEHEMLRKMLIPMRLMFE
ncbi:MAG: GNAT family N-acetyltransferase [Chloroflexota bacterium]